MCGFLQTICRGLTRYVCFGSLFAVSHLVTKTSPGIDCLKGPQYVGYFKAHLLGCVWCSWWPADHETVPGAAGGRQIMILCLVLLADTDLLPCQCA